MQAQSDKYPLVSVLCFCKNCAHTIQRCIDSVIAQDYPNIDIIVQDGASTDGTVEILQSYGDKIKLVSEPDSAPQEGLSRSLARIQGEFFGSCLSDEELMPHAVSWGVKNLLKYPDVAAIYGDHYITDIDGNITGIVRPPRWDFVSYLCSEITPPFCSSFFRRSCYEAVGFSEYTAKDEFDFWINLGVRFPIRYVPSQVPVTKYAVHPQASGFKGHRQQERLASRTSAIEKLCNDPATPEHIRKLRDKAIAGLYVWHVDSFCCIGLWEQVKKEAHKAFGSGAAVQMLRPLACKIYRHSIELYQEGRLEESLEFLDLFTESNVTAPEITRQKEQIFQELTGTNQRSKPREQPNLCQIKKDNLSTNCGVITTEFDAGLCNRFYQWTIIRELSEYYNMDVAVWWPEIKNKTLKLPNTRFLDFSKTSKVFIKVDTTKFNNIADLNLNPNKNYSLICNCGYNRNLVVDQDKRLNEVRLGPAYAWQIDLLLAKYSDSPIVGLHVRKGDYEITDKFVTDVSGFRLPDSWYLKMADQILVRFPDVRFFLATNGTDEEKQIFLKNLPIITIDNCVSAPRQDVLELFTLTKLPLLITSCSTFSNFAALYGEKPVKILPESPNQNIVKELQQFQPYYDKKTKKTSSVVISSAKKINHQREQILQNPAETNPPSNSSIEKSVSRPHSDNARIEVVSESQPGEAQMSHKEKDFSGNNMSKPYRFLMINADYGHFLQQLYRRNPGLNTQSFNAQHIARMQTLFGLSDFYSGNLHKLGHEAIDLIYNNHFMQYAWAVENGLMTKQIEDTDSIAALPNEWLAAVFEAQVKAFKPDVIVNLAMEMVTSEILNKVKPDVRLIIGQHAAPLTPSMEDLSAYDLLLSSLPNYLDYFTQKGKKSEYFKLAFETTILDAVPSKEERSVDIAFVGGFSPHHLGGADLFNYLADQGFSMDLYGYDHESLSPKARDFFKGGLYGKDMFELYARAKIVINRHISISGDYSNNLRLYESTGMGTLLITDWKKNLGEFFDVGSEVVAYHSKEECAELVRHYLGNTEERLQIAKNGQKRTLTEHTFYNRMSELSDIAEKHINSNSTHCAEPAVSLPDTQAPRLLGKRPQSNSIDAAPKNDPMKVLLVNPPARRFVFLQGANFPLGLGYIAAVLEKEGHNVKIYDAEWSPALFYTECRPQNALSYMAENWYKYFEALKNPNDEVWHEVEKVFREHNPQVIGITSRVLDLPSAQILARIAKKINKETIVVFGGPAATTCTEQIMQDQNVDFVVRHEGEITMSELLKALQNPQTDLHSIDGLSFREAGRIVNNKNRPLITDISALPFPARHLLLYTDKLPTGCYNRMNGEIVTSRGCSYPCSFCANHSVWASRKPRMRKAEDVVDEILHQRDTYGVRMFTIWDDLFTSNRQRTFEICNLLIEKKANVNWLCLVRADTIDDELLELMKRSGCVEVQIGIESGNDRILKRMRKGITVEQIRKAAEMIRRAELCWRAFFLIGIPGETREEMEDTMRIIYEIKPDAAELSVFAPYPGSELYEEVEEKGLLNKNEQGWLHADFLNVDYCYVETMPHDQFRELAIDYLRQCDEYNNRMGGRNTMKQILEKIKAAALENRFGNFQIQFNGLDIYCHDLLSFYMSSKDIFLNRIYDFETTNPAPKIIDGGGHIGLFTLFAKQKYPGAQITVFEPDDESWQLLNQNLKANGIKDVNAVKAGLYECDKEMSFGSDHSDGSSIFSKNKNNTIMVERLSKYINSEIDFLKLNIEGAEVSVIKEIEHKLPLVKEMVIEYHGFPETGQHLHKILEILNRCGYRYIIHDFDNETNPATKPPFKLEKDTSFFLLIYAKKIFSAIDVDNPAQEHAGDNKLLQPVSRLFGTDRGTPIDRYYIESFLKANSSCICGRVLEVADNGYTQKYGANVTQSDVLSSVPSQQATIVGDLATGENIPSETFDCIILTQTIQMIYDVKSALKNAVKALKPGGTLLITASGISQISRYDMDRWGEYWRFTDKSLKMLITEIVPEGQIEVQTYGNVAAAKGFLDGRAAHELDRQALDYRDEDYQVLLTARACKKAGVTKVERTTNRVSKERSSFQSPLVLLYHRVADDPIDSQLLAVYPDNFDAHLRELVKNYKVVPLSELLEQAQQGHFEPDTVAITFDDGYADSLTNALPLLEKYALPATIFVTSGMIGSDREFWWDEMERIFLTNHPLPDSLEISDSQGLLQWDLTTAQNRIKAWEELCEMLRILPVTKIDQIVDMLLTWANLPLVARDSHLVLNPKQLLELNRSKLIEIGSHTLSHSRLSILPLKDQLRETLISKRQLEFIIGKSVNLISYPYGGRDDFTEQTIQIVKKDGYRAGIANIQANLTLPVDAYAVPRRLVRNWTGDVFAQWMCDKGVLEAHTLSERASRLIQLQTNKIQKENRNQLLGIR